MSGWVNLHWAHWNLEDPENPIMEFTHTYHYVEDETECLNTIPPNQTTTTTLWE